ncbi:MAG TPA: hypothetical protein VIT68_02200 [Candidatus Gracilibacteria bacterium]
MKKIIIVLAFLLIPSLVWAQVIPKMEFYHGEECPHCKKQHKWLPELREMYPDLEIEIYEVWHDEANQKKMQARLDELGKESTGVPTNIIEGDVIVGFNPEAILESLARHYGPPAEVEPKALEDNTVGDNASIWQKFLNWIKGLFS